MIVRAVVLLAFITLSIGEPAVAITVLTNQGTGQDAFIYTNRNVTNALSPSVFAFPVGTTGEGHDTFGLVKFDTTLLRLSSAQVGTATMRLLSQDTAAATGFGLSPDATHPLTIAVSPLTSGFDRNTVKLSNRPTFGAQVTSFVVSQTGAYVDVDITSLVKGWLDAPATNFGVQLTSLTILGTSPLFYASSYDSGWEAIDPENPDAPVDLNTTTAPQLVVVPLPEPSTWLLLAAGVPALLLTVRRRIRRRHVQSPCRVVRCIAICKNAV